MVKWGKFKNLGLTSTAISIIDRMCILDLYTFIRRKVSGSQVAIIQYHRVGPKSDNWSISPLSPEIFKKHVEYLSKRYEIVSLDEIARCIRQEKGLRQKAVAITFDDGYLDNYLYAYPILAQYKAPATIFLTTGHISSDKLFWWDKVGYIIQNTSETQIRLDELGSYVVSSIKDKMLAQERITEALKKFDEDQKNILINKLMVVAKTHIPDNLSPNLMMSWAQIKEMSENGIVFGAHTINHPILTNISLEQARLEIIESKIEVEKRIGKEVALFSYPNGNYNNKIAELVKNFGFVCAVSTTPQKLLSPRDDVLTLSRLGGGVRNMGMLKIQLSGLLGDLHLSV
jgi:peptidoglycan/xylan/chitin deacetylase (PgdA/CDA1 family)